jgi:MarR family
MASRMTAKRIGDLLERIGCVRHPCDLDLLLFFYRHPRAFLIVERLAQYVGYELPRVTHSLETLITAGLLRQSPDSSLPARLYVLAPGSTAGEWVSSLLGFATTRPGRLAVIQALKQRQSLGLSGGGAPEPDPNAGNVPWRLQVPYA